jgi:hypothetical protein
MYFMVPVGLSVGIDIIFFKHGLAVIDTSLRYKKSFISKNAAMRVSPFLEGMGKNQAQLFFKVNIPLSALLTSLLREFLTRKYSVCFMLHSRKLLG